MCEAQIVIDEEAARVQARRFKLGLEVVSVLFGENAKVGEEAREVVIDIAKLTEKLGFGLVSYENGA